VLSQFGTNWSEFSRVVGNVVGPLIGYEVLTAFFLEASFLGILLFGWNRVPPTLHVIAAILVAVGTLFSAFWILSANSWMQHPAGHLVENGLPCRMTGSPSLQSDLPSASPTW
jgi:cytochrome d ubiquinol oxidase subunit I